MEIKRLLMKAVYDGDFFWVKTLFAGHRILFQKSSQDIKDAFVNAAVYKHKEILEYLYTELLHIEADINVIHRYRKYTAIEAATAYGHIDIVDFLLTKKPILQNYTQPNALMLAIQKGHTKIFEKLLAYDPQLVNSPSKGYLPLAMAARCQNKEIVKKLIEHNAYLEGQPASSWLSFFCFKYPIPIIEATKQADVITMLQLLKAGADINKTDHNHENALHHAVRGRCFILVNALLAHGIDTSQVSASKKTPLDLAQAMLAEETSPMLEKIVTALETQKEYSAVKYLKY